MRVAAWAEVGIDLIPVSSFRDFDRQLGIWNGKMRGERPLLDRMGRALDASRLDLDARIDAILAWSALPGGSRHHWGTDFDAIDAAAVTQGYIPRLVPEEYSIGGPFEVLSLWLGANARRFGFGRPYEEALGGVQPEPWHLSYAPIADRALVELTPEVLRAQWDDAASEGRTMDGAERVIERLPELHARYIANVRTSNRD